MFDNTKPWLRAKVLILVSLMAFFGSATSSNAQVGDPNWCTVVPDECIVPGTRPGETPPEDTIGMGGQMLRMFGGYHDWIDFVQLDPFTLDPQVIDCMAEQMTEEERDEAARDAADLLRTAPGVGYNEWGTIIWYDGVNYRRGAVVEGNSSSVPLDFSEGRSNEVVAAIVHTHPLNSWSAPTETDWNTLANVNTTPDGGAHYIYNYGDYTLYEYDSLDSPRREGETDGTSENAVDAAGNCNV